MSDELKDEQLDLLGSALWAVWLERNKVLWHDEGFDPAFSVQWVST